MLSSVVVVVVVAAAAAMKGGGGKRKASTSEAPNDVVVVVAAASAPSDDADLGVGDVGGVKVQNFEGNEGTQLRNTEEQEEEPHHVEGDEGGEDEEDYAEGEEEYEEENGGAVAGGQQGFPALGENFFEVEAIRRKRLRKVKSSLFSSSFVVLGYVEGYVFSLFCVVSVFFNYFICNGDFLFLVIFCSNGGCLVSG